MQGKHKRVSAVTGVHGCHRNLNSFMALTEQQVLFLIHHLSSPSHLLYAVYSSTYSSAYKMFKQLLLNTNLKLSRTLILYR